MGRTIADALREEGLKEGLKTGRKEGEIRALQRTLIRLLRERFGDLPEKIAETIKTTKDVRKLDAWLERIVSVSTLAEMNISEGI